MSAEQNLSVLERNLQENAAEVPLIDFGDVFQLLSVKIKDSIIELLSKDHAVAKKIGLLAQAESITKDSNGSNLSPDECLRMIKLSEGEFSTHKVSIEDLKKVIEDSKKDRDEIKSSQTEMNKNIDKMNNDIADIKKDVANTNNRISKIDVGDIYNHISGFYDDIREVNDKISDVQDDVDRNLEAHKRKHRKRDVSQMEKEIIGMKQKISSLESEVDELKEKVNISKTNNVPPSKFMKDLFDNFKMFWINAPVDQTDFPKTRRELRESSEEIIDKILTHYKLPLDGDRKNKLESLKGYFI